MFNKFIRYFIYFTFIPFWWLQSLLPRNSKVWIFGAWYGEKYTDNAKFLFEYTNGNSSKVKCIWLTKNHNLIESIRNKGYECFHANSVKGIYWSLRAGCVIFSSGKVDINPFFINGAKLINTWHGVPMKKIGLDDKLGLNKNKNKFLNLFFPFVWEYDLTSVVSTADLFIDILSSAFNIPATKIICSGYPRNDAFFSQEENRIILNINQKFNNPIKVIYLPTFREADKRFEPFKSYDFIDSKWKKFLDNTNAVLISKGHFIDKYVGNNSFSERVIHLTDNNTDDLNDLLKGVDILITDYSGVYFDFLITQKPIIFAPFDFTDYISKSRELYFDYQELICGPVAMNWNEVMNSIEELLTNDIYKHQRFLMNQKFNKYHDSNNSARLFGEICKLTNVD